ncbi:hypothetical protein EQK42_23165, partial [Streptomyces albidoflavus]
MRDQHPPAAADAPAAPTLTPERPARTGPAAAGGCWSRMPAFGPGWSRGRPPPWRHPSGPRMSGCGRTYRAAGHTGPEGRRSGVAGLGA